MAESTARSTPADRASDLITAIAQRDFHRLTPDERDPFPLWADVPDWVPRKGYTRPTRDVLRAVEAGLRRKL